MRALTVNDSVSCVRACFHECACACMRAYMMVRTRVPSLMVLTYLLQQIFTSQERFDAFFKDSMALSALKQSSNGVSGSMNCNGDQLGGFLHLLSDTR